MDNEVTTPGEILKMIRQRKNLKQETVGLQLDIPRSTIASMENGSSNPAKMATDTFFALARVYEMSPTSLYNTLFGTTGGGTEPGDYQTIEIPTYLDEEDLVALYDYVSLLAVRRRVKGPSSSAVTIDNTNGSPTATEIIISQPFSDWLCDEMRKRGLGVSELAAQIGIEAALISQHAGNPERGRKPTRRPDLENLSRYAKFFGSNTLELAKLAGYNIA